MPLVNNLSRPQSERQSLRQQREEFGERTQADVLSLEASLANARDLRNAAGDSVRRLEPIARAARKSERGKVTISRHLLAQVTLLF